MAKGSGSARGAPRGTPCNLTTRRTSRPVGRAAILAIAVVFFPGNVNVFEIICYGIKIFLLKIFVYYSLFKSSCFLSSLFGYNLCCV